MFRLITALLLATFLFAACGDSEGDPTAEVPTGGDLPTAPGGGAAGTMPDDVGPPISVAEALERGADESFVIQGYLFQHRDGTYTLSDEIAESFPPQPAGAQVKVGGFDPTLLPLMEGPADAEIAITAWTEEPVQLYGTIVDGVFVGTPLPVS